MHARPVLIVHNGALGDFLCAWPAIRSLLAVHPYAFWAGRETYSQWVLPLGAARVSPDLRDGLQRLYGATAMPRALRGARVFWFGLERAPWDFEHPELIFLPSTIPGSFEPPRSVHRRVLTRCGVAMLPDWRKDWQRRFGASRYTSTGPVLLFPGAGHRLKQWPLVQFLELAELVERAGSRPVFVLGPAEVERGMAIKDFRTAQPQDFAALSALLLSARAVAGNDSGPMHLAGMHNVPGVVLFGPTSPGQWAPPGLIPLAPNTGLAPNMGCAPCTRTTADIECLTSHCLDALSVQAVLQTLRPLVE